MESNNRQTAHTPPAVLLGLPDARQRTTMRAALEWAYGPECVRFSGAVDNLDGYASVTSATGVVCRILETGQMGRGSNVAWAQTSFGAHPDAETIHAAVCGLDREAYWLVVRAAETGLAPEWNPDLPPFRLRPILKANGKPRMLICPTLKRPVACLVKRDGYTADEAEAIRAKARMRYALWAMALARVADEVSTNRNSLKRWKIEGIGIDAMPWLALARVDLDFAAKT